MVTIRNDIESNGTANGSTGMADAEKNVNHLANGSRRPTLAEIKPKAFNRKCVSFLALIVCIGVCFGVGMLFLYGHLVDRLNESANAGMMLHDSNGNTIMLLSTTRATTTTTTSTTTEASSTTTSITTTATTTSTLPKEEDTIETSKESDESSREICIDCTSNPQVAPKSSEVKGCTGHPCESTTNVSKSHVAVISDDEDDDDDDEDYGSGDEPNDPGSGGHK